jgi:hypothetical protein
LGTSAEGLGTSAEGLVPGLSSWLFAPLLFLRDTKKVGLAQRREGAKKEMGSELRLTVLASASIAPTSTTANCPSIKS